MRAVDGSGELAVASYELFFDTEILGRWPWSGCSPGSRPAATQPGWSRSDPHRAGGHRDLALGSVALVDGVHFAEYTCVVALGIGIDGTKYPLSLVEGSTENAALVTDLIVSLR
jgi:hypothetical protein